MPRFNAENTLAPHFYKGKLSVLPIRLDRISSNGRTKSANCRIKNRPTGKFNALTLGTGPLVSEQMSNFSVILFLEADEIDSKC